MTVSDIIVSSTFELVGMALFIWGYANKDKVIAWEEDQWAKIKRFIRRLLRKSDRIVAWAEKPTKHGRPDEEWITGQVKVWGDEWK